jgi:acyl carrier protein
VCRLLGTVLGRSIDESEDLSRMSEPLWDSLRHVELIFLLEDYFGIRFTAEDLEALNNIEGIVRTVEARRAP